MNAGRKEGRCNSISGGLKTDLTPGARPDPMSSHGVCTHMQSYPEKGNIWRVGDDREHYPLTGSMEIITIRIVRLRSSLGSLSLVPVASNIGARP